MIPLPNLDPDQVRQSDKLGRWSWHIEANTMDCSKEVYQIYGLHENATGLSHENFFGNIHSADVEDLKRAMSEVVKGTPFSIVHRIVEPDGTLRYVHMQGKVARDKSGRPARVDGTAVDVTQRKKMERALHESEERFSLAMRGANDGLWDWNLETDEVYYSPRWKTMLGYAESELENHLDTWSKLVHPDDKERILHKVRDYVAGRLTSFEAEMRMRHKDGHDVFILSRAFLDTRKDDDKPVRLVGTHLDITERKKSQAFDEKYSGILEMIATGQPASNIYDAIALMYEDRHPGLRCSMLELHGNVLLHGGAPSLPKEYCEAVNGLVNGPDIGSCGTATYTGKRVLVESIETDPKWADIKHVALPHGMRCCWSEPIKNSSGKVLGAFGMYYNHPALPNEAELSDLQSASRLAGIIMERVHNEIELNTHRQKLEELVEERTAEVKEKSARLEEALEKEKEYNVLQQKFVSLVSHEFRTPLTIIDGAAQRLIRRKNRLTPEETEKRSESVRSAVKRLISLIDLTLHSSRLDAEKIEIRPTSCDVKSLIQEVCDRQAEIAPSFTIDVDIAALPDAISADKNLLDLVFTNLLSNAIKYSPNNGLVEVGASAENGCATIWVIDNGVGIPKDELPNMFKRFFRARTAEGFGGTGIGLSISKEFVEMHGGTIEVQSQEGRGSTFRVSLPLTAKDAGQKAA